MRNESIRPSDPMIATNPIDGMPALKFHHVGVACKDLEQETAKLSILGYRAAGKEFLDPLQGVRGRFLSGQFPQLELLVSTGEHGVLDPWLKSNTKLYHLAYLAGDLDVTITQFVKQRAIVVVKPIEAVAFDYRRISFLMLPNMLLIELIEQPKRP